MPGAYFRQLFGRTARDLQVQAGSRESYAAREAADANAHDPLTDRELSYLAARDSVYLASTTSDGWPYVQHRGGPPGFIRSLGENRIGFSEYPGNRQYISLGNIVEGGRIAIFAMNYAARRRLKLIGHARIVSASADPELVAKASHPSVSGAGLACIIDVVGFDWNCPKYIEPRFTRAEIDAELGPLLAENASLRAKLARLEGEAD